MKKTYIVLGIIVLLVILGFLFINTYTSSPGFTTQEVAEQFEANKPNCYGFEFLLNAEEMMADAPGRSLCIGLLK